MSKKTLFLIRTESDQEAVMNISTRKDGGFTQKGFKEIGSRFYDGIQQKPGRLKQCLNLEAFSNGLELAQAIARYNKETL